MKIHIGTSGYGYPAWKGKFYPKKMPTDQMLQFYAEHFRAVEINNSFYRMPAGSVLQGWLAKVPSDFQFAIKSPRTITHSKTPLEPSERVSELFNVIKVLGGQLGPVLFQLPPYFKKDLPRLRRFLEALPPSYRFAFEFRHQSWFDDDVLQVLGSHRSSLCIAEDDNELAVPSVATADWGYLRLRRLDHTDTQLKTWADWIKKQKWSEAFVFFKHEDRALGAVFAERFQQLI